MAVERGLGSGGLPKAPMIPEQEILQNVIDLPAQPGVTEFDDGSAIIGEYEEEQAPIADVGFDGNLAEVVDEAELGRISSDLVGSIEDDLAAREDWEDTYKRGLEFLGMKTEERSEPFEGSSGVIHPLLAESVTQFQAQAYRELLPATGPVRTSVVGAHACIRVNLSAPLLGVNGVTGMPMRLNSCVKGIPLAFCSTRTMSGSYMSYNSCACCFNSGNSQRPRTASNKTI